jgi:hypothetical protein
VYGQFPGTRVYFSAPTTNQQHPDNMKISHETAAAETSIFRTGGYCKRCGREHWLGPGNTLNFCRKLMQRLDLLETIDLFSTEPGPITALGTAPLFGPARGKMFGVMECLTPDGTTVILHAFSGQFNGVWLVDGWVPPLFEINDFLTLTVGRERQIKELGRTIEQCLPHSSDWLMQRKKRRLLSRKLMSDIHSLYRLVSFRGVTAGLEEAFTGSNGIPTGTGDCCAPKLLQFAAKNNLRPLGISEFFWGRENRSGEHCHGSFAASCVEKCRPILGFLLCGLDE